MGIYINFILFFLLMNADSVISKCGGLIEITRGTEVTDARARIAGKDARGPRFSIPSTQKVNHLIKIDQTQSLPIQVIANELFLLFLINGIDGIMTSKQIALFVKTCLTGFGIMHTSKRDTHQEKANEHQQNHFQLCKASRSGSDC